MSPERIEFIHSILSSEDLAIGFTTEDPHRPFTFAGGGRKVVATRDVAEKLLSLMEKHWGNDAIATRVLQTLLGILPANETGAAE